MAPIRIAAIWEIEDPLNKNDQRRRDRNGCPLRIGAERACHAPNRLSHDRDGDKLEAVKQPDPGRAAEFTRAVSEQHQSCGGRQRKAGPRRETAPIAGAHQTDGKSDPAAGGTGKKLAQADKIGIGVLVDPAAAHDELVAKISDVGDRSAEAGDA